MTRLERGARISCQCDDRNPRLETGDACRATPGHPEHIEAGQATQPIKPSDRTAVVPGWTVGRSDTAKPTRRDMFTNSATW